MQITIDISDAQFKQLSKIVNELLSVLKVVKTCEPCHHDHAAEEPIDEEVVPKTPLEDIKCQNCGNIFTPTRKTQVYCCAKCRLQGNNKKRSVQSDYASAKFTAAEPAEPEEVKQPKTIKCKHCGKDFVPNRGAKFCSVECRNAFHVAARKAEQPKLEEITCATCGQKFTPSRKNARFCSTECRTVYFQWEHGSREFPLATYLANHGFKGCYGTAKCAHCGKDFVKTTVDQKYCSKECKLEHRQIRLDAAAKLVAEGKPTNSMVGKEICQVCKMPFSPIDKAQRFCDKCLRTFNEEGCERIVHDEQLEKEQKKKSQKHVMDNQFKVCPRCGNTFHDPLNEKFFCDKCTRKARNVPKIKPLEDDPSLKGVEV